MLAEDLLWLKIYLSLPKICLGQYLNCARREQGKRPAANSLEISDNPPNKTILSLIHSQKIYIC